MAPPTRLRPHLNDLLQKNLELEHVVADLRHQLTQSSAKWADERKTLVMGCDSLMASFAKFRARLDVHPSDWGDSEGEVEQNLDTGRQSEETGGVDNGKIETEREQGSLATEDLYERCRVLIAEVRAKDEALEESRRKHEAVEEELQRVQRLLDSQSEQLRTAPASSKADAGDKLSPERASDGPSTEAIPPKTGAKSTIEKLDLANQEISQLKQLLQDWKKYGNEWKQDGQMSRVRISELQRREDELATQINAAEETKALLDAEIQRLTSALANQTAEVEHQRTACQESVKRVQDLEAMITRLRARLSPEQLASFDSEQNQATPEPSSSTQPPMSHADTNANKRNDLIVLKIPSRGSVRKPVTEDVEPQDEPQNGVSSQQAPATLFITVNPALQKSNSAPSFSHSEFEICIHTCNPFPCRNDSRSFLWSRRKPSLPRHALSTKKHHRCSPDCPGYRLLNMPLQDALKEPRGAKCRPPTETELALAAEENKGIPHSERTGEKGTGVDGASGVDGAGEPEEHDSSSEENPEGGRSMGKVAPTSPAIRGYKRVRSRTTDGEESQRVKKPRRRITIPAKS